MWRWVRAIVIWISVLVMGWGTETVFALSVQSQQRTNIKAMTLNIQPKRTYTHELKTLKEKYAWMIVQLFFPLCLSIALYSNSVFGLPFLVVGLWKFGTPETVNYFSTSFQSSVSCLYATACFLAGVGTVLHHAFSSWFICANMNGLMSPVHVYRHMAVTTPLVVQHWFSWLSHCNFYAYVIVELVAEVWWEIEMFSNFSDTYLLHEKVTFMALLLAHWLYWLSGVLELDQVKQLVVFFGRFC
jgi:hypothetical protein